jgi:hypothetical protein
MLPRSACWLVLLAACRAQDPPSGKLIEAVRCLRDSAQSYALYLPARYTPEHNWPIVYCFDPGARGRIPVERLRDAAEEFGYIVVGSNNSRNGSGAVAEAAANALWIDTHARFAMDPKRIYTAGLSGGARVATGLALSAKLTGVIASSAAFPNSSVPKSVPLVFFGTAGYDDFNYLEMARVHRTLDRMSVPNRFAFFDGGHEWPSASLYIEAVGWLELCAMKKGLRPRDPALIDRVLQDRLARLEATHGSYETALLTEALANDFEGLIDVAAYRAKAEALMADKSFKDAERNERRLEDRQERLQTDLMSQAEQRGGPWRAMLADLREKSGAIADSPDRRVARRVLQGSFALFFEEGRGLLDEGKYRAAADKLTVATDILADRPFALYELARAGALSGDRKQALRALNKCAALGFHNAKIATEPAFEKFRDDPVFAKLK